MANTVRPDAQERAQFLSDLNWQERTSSSTTRYIYHYDGAIHYIDADYEVSRNDASTLQITGKIYVRSQIGYGTGSSYYGDLEVVLEDTNGNAVSGYVTVQDGGR